MKNNTEIFPGDVFWADVSTSGMHTTKGMRPWIIVSCLMCNGTSPNVTAVPCTTRVKTKIQTHVHVNLRTRLSTAMCEEVQTFGKEMLQSHLCKLSHEELLEIREALAIHMDIFWRWGHEEKER